jgi:hypothetical protein
VHRNTDSNVIYVFHVSIDLAPKLHLLMQYEISAPWSCVSLAEDTLMMLWRTFRSETLTVVAVNFSSLAPSRNGRPPMHQYTIAPIVSFIYMLRTDNS